MVAERDQLKVADAAVPVVQDLLGSDIALEAADRWNQTIENLESLSSFEPEKPESLDVEFRDYQLEGYQWLARLSRWGVGGILADDMGLGKTVQTLGALVDRGGEGPALVIAPTSVGDNWVRETERLPDHFGRCCTANRIVKSWSKSAQENDVVIVSYQLVQRDAKAFSSRHWHTLVLDEAQFIKNAQTKTSRAIRGIDAGWRIALSGTPLENHLGELWSLMRTISPGLLGSWTDSERDLPTRSNVTKTRSVDSRCLGSFDLSYFAERKKTSSKNFRQGRKSHCRRISVPKNESDTTTHEWRRSLNSRVRRMRSRVNTACEHLPG